MLIFLTINYINNIDQRFPTFIYSRTPKEEKEISRTPCELWRVIFFENLSVNTKLMKIWGIPWDFSRTPEGTRTPGWEPLI